LAVESARERVRRDPLRLLRRAVRLVLAPSREWATIAAERPSTPALLVGLVLPFSTIPAIAWSCGLSIFGLEVGRQGEATTWLPLETIVRIGVGTFAGTALTIVGTAVAFYAIAPMYEVRRDWRGALTVASFGAAPVALASVLLVKPILIFAPFVAALHSFYLFNAGLQHVCRVAPGRAAEYVAIALFLVMVVSTLAGGLLGAAGIL